ncbi:hypothetical protein TrVFT333_002847 [Trichoderma virens FT-333]|nr:hypothetical protein TrVFT333_002847 [Trichoderma virens FT-333]
MQDRQLPNNHNNIDRFLQLLYDNLKHQTGPGGARVSLTDRMQERRLGLGRGLALLPTPNQAMTSMIKAAWIG